MQHIRGFFGVDVQYKFTLHSLIYSLLPQLLITFIIAQKWELHSNQVFSTGTFSWAREGQRMYRSSGQELCTHITYFSTQETWMLNLTVEYRIS